MSGVGAGRHCHKLAKPLAVARTLSHVPVDDLVSGLTEEQIEVSSRGKCLAGK